MKDDPKPPRWWAILGYLPDIMFACFWSAGFAAGFTLARIWPGG